MAAKATRVYSREELEAMETVQPSIAQQQEIERESRATIAIESPLSPETLCGSWALYHSQDETKQGLVVAEPQAGIYLVQTYDVITDSPGAQVLLTIEALAKVDDGGGTWTFYDCRADVREAFRGMIK